MAKKQVKTPLDLLKKYAKIFKKSNFDMSLETVKSTFAHVYYIWRTLKPELPYEDALSLYGGVWDSVAEVSVASAKRILGIDEVKNIQQLGEIMQYCFTVVPCVYETVKSTPDEVIGHILWCANPCYGPADNIELRHDYYRQEAKLSVQYIRTVARLCGMEDKAFVDQDLFQCRDGSTDFCRIIIRKK